MMSKVVKFEESILFFHKEYTGLGEGETWADLFPLPNSNIDPLVMFLMLMHLP